MKKIAVIGAGITGVSAARMLSGKSDVTVFESNNKIGGLIRCDVLPEGLYHKLGGHVFNTKSPEVAKWFWSFFDQDREFHKLTRDARILFGDSLVGYPLENHLYQLPEADITGVVSDLLNKAALGDAPMPTNFKDALLSIFGRTLSEKYFFPYNEKVWRTNLATIPTDWLEGKLPLPGVKDILLSNILRKQETSMVHAKFYYAKQGGSQFVIERLAEGLNVRLNTTVKRLEKADQGQGWFINGNKSEVFDQVVSTADIRTLDKLLPEVDKLEEYSRLKKMRTRGISNVFCECDKSDVSWLYIPEAKYAANRIIYTGAFAPSNNSTQRMTCVVEFVYGEADAIIDRDIAALPGNLKKIAMNHVQDAYVIQEKDTRSGVAVIKKWAAAQGIYQVGRFAEWEYYNIDKAIEAVLLTIKELND